MNMNRRSFIGLSAGIPMTRFESFPNRALADSLVDSLQIENGLRIFSISPDGSTLLGISEQDEVVFLATDSTEEISRSEAFVESKIIDPVGISWSPDSAKVAFSLDGWRLARDSDIFIATVETGRTVNATPEGHTKEADSMLEQSEGPVVIDISPVWLDDDTILFARHRTGNGAFTVELVTLTAESGEVSPWLEMDPAKVSFVTNRLTLIDDNEVAFFGGNEKSLPIIVLASQVGGVEIVDTGEMQAAFPTSLGKTSAVVLDQQNFALVRISYDGSVAPKPIEDVFQLEQGVNIIVGPTYGPDGESLVGLTQDHHVLIADADGGREIGSIASDADVSGANMFWVEGSVLIAGRGGAWQIPIH